MEGHFRTVCMSGVVDDVEQFIDMFDYQPSSHIFQEICAEGHLELAKWWVGRFNITSGDIRANDNEIIRNVCNNSHQDLAEWLIEQFDLNKDDYGEFYSVEGLGSLMGPKFAGLMGGESN